MKLTTYIREAVEEMKKVVWPTKKQTINYSIVVIALSIGMAVFFGVLDFGFSKGLSAILPERGGVPTTGSHSAVPVQEATQDALDQVGTPELGDIEGLDIEQIPLEPENTDQ